ncbi:MAG: T9SS type A sorting domain-containing protein [Bacteroidales bacterium]|nr:T9SS type A sorting domain-containing protein [Bacteroidales bacterium]
MAIRGIDYAAEKTKEVIDNTLEYSSSSAFSGSTTGNGNRISVVPGSTTYFRKKYTSGSFVGQSLKLTAPKRPSIVSDNGDTISLKQFTVTVKFPATVSGFASNDISVSNATVKSISGTYKASIEPKNTGLVNLSIPANAVSEGNFSSSVLKVYYLKATGVNILPKLADIKLYPNPAIEKLVFEIDAEESKTYTVAIYNLSGKKLISESFSDKVSEVDLQNIKAGTYIVEINDGVSQQRRKLIKL